MLLTQLNWLNQLENKPQRRVYPRIHLCTEIFLASLDPLRIIGDLMQNSGRFNGVARGALPMDSNADSRWPSPDADRLRPRYPLDGPESIAVQSHHIACETDVCSLRGTWFKSRLPSMLLPE